MGKREAENQLTQDNWEQEEGAGENGGEFRKASTDAIAGRKIRGIPKRRGAAGAATSTPQPSAGPGAAPRPSPFASSFGAPAAASPNPFAALSATPAPSDSTGSSPFAFGAPAVKPAANGAAPAPSFAFGAASSFGAPSSSTPSSTSAFSFGTSPTPLFGASKPAAPQPVGESSGKDTQAASLKYYTALRALNLSLVDALTLQIDKDPFADLSAAGGFDKLRSKYEEHRKKVESEYEAAGGKVEGKKETAGAMQVDKPAAAAVPAFEIPEIFRNPPKPVPIADLTPKDDNDDGIPAIFRNPPKPVPIADLTDSASSTDIPDIFKNPPKPVPIADLTEEKADSKAAPPAPPAVFSFAGSAVKPSASSPTSPPKVAGFVFNPSAPKDPYAEKSTFSFPAAASSSSLSSSAPSTSTSKDDRASLKPPSAPKLAPAKLTNPPAKPSPLRFGQSVSPPASPDKPEEKKETKAGAFNFAVAFGGVAKGEAEKKEEPKKAEEKKTPFSFTSTSASTSTPSKSSATAPTPFSTPAFGSTATSTPNLFSFGGSKPAASPPIATSFGAASPPTFGFGAALQGKDKDKALGSPGSGQGRTGFAFGSGIGSTGFSFAPAATKTEGAEEKKAEPAKLSGGFTFAPTTAFSTTPAAAASPFSFGTSTSRAPPAAPSASTTAAPTPDSESTDTSSQSQTPGANPFAAPGAGEEGETALFVTRGRVYKLKGTESELLGVANVSIKSKEVEGKKKVRVLARNETNGSVVINFSLHPALTLNVQKLFITFTGFDAEAKPVIYRIRVKDLDAVSEFEKAVEEGKGLLA
ncbi:hypothetical protein JCM11641_003672 [Rhodosporidiobolus odoratus]